MKKRKMLENQGVDVNIDELEDEVWERNEKGEFLPIASYWLDTTLQTVEAGTYSDPTGTIKT